MLTYLTQTKSICLTSRCHQDISYESLHDIMRTDTTQPGIDAFDRKTPLWFTRGEPRTPVVLEIGDTTFTLYGEPGVLIPAETLCELIVLGAHFKVVQHGMYLMKKVNIFL